MKTTPLYPRHHSVGPGVVLKPHNMDKLTGMSPEQRIWIEEQALSIFTDCTNANMTFRDALTAILLSGIDWGRGAMCDCQNAKAALLPGGDER